ncbi:hypothetical protein [Sorangium cellulosum]|nr:hypothetical protein [Sorangium cellulosum]
MLAIVLVGLDARAALADAREQPTVEDDADDDAACDVLRDSIIERGKCFNACDAGTEVFFRYCRTLPDRMRGACWFSASESNAACKRAC